MRRALDDRQLVEQSIGGDREAFGVLVGRYQSLICAVTYSATGSIDRSEELAQEAFLRAWKNLPQLKDVSRFRAWLCTIARNLARRAIERRRRDVVDRAAGLDAAESATDGCDPCERLVGKEQQEAVWAALEAIPPAYREPMVLFYRRQQSVSQVAADLELSEHVVRQRLYRGRQLLKVEVSSVVEETLGRSGPGKAFAIAVVAALPAVTAQTASAAVAGAVAKSAEGVPAAKAVIAGGLSGAVLGPILGLLGGVFGAWCSIRNTRSVRERRFMIRMTVLVWLLLCGLIGVPLVLMLMGVVPRWLYWTCFTVFFCILIPLIPWGNRRQHQIQVEDGTFVPPPHVHVTPPRSAVYASFGGALAGSTLWLMILAGIAQDWAALAGVLGGVAVLLSVTVRIAGRRQRYWTAAYLALAGIAVLTFGAVNLRWHHWMAAYRRSTLYDPTNDVSLKTINLIMTAAFLLALTILTLTARRRRRHARATT